MLDGESFSQGAKCVLSDSDGKFKFPDFYINTRRKKGNVLSISAIDRTVYLGQIFDYTSVEVEEDNRIDGLRHQIWKGHGRIKWS